MKKDFIFRWTIPQSLFSQKQLHSYLCRVCFDTKIWNYNMSITNTLHRNLLFRLLWGNVSFSISLTLSLSASFLSLKLLQGGLIMQHCVLKFHPINNSVEPQWPYVTGSAVLTDLVFVTFSVCLLKTQHTLALFPCFFQRCGEAVDSGPPECLWRVSSLGQIRPGCTIASLCFRFALSDFHIWNAYWSSNMLSI